MAGEAIISTPLMVKPSEAATATMYSFSGWLVLNQNQLCIAHENRVQSSQNKDAILTAYIAKMP
ncbi:hypothetical protein THIOSC13_670005 [uncultured Thiomicrorhabdus sp.]